MRGPVRVNLLALLVAGATMIFAGIAAPSQAVAGWLAGGSLGMSKTYDYSVGGPIDDIDETDFAFRAFGGYTFMRNFGVALSYVDLGEMTADGPAFGGFTDTLSTKGLDLSAVGILPVAKQFGFFGTLGLFRWEQDVHYRDSGGNYDYEDRGTSFSYGVGANVDLTPAHTSGIHIEYQVFTNVGDEDNSGHEYDRTFISVGYLYRFPTK